MYFTIFVNKNCSYFLNFILPLSPKMVLNLWLFNSKQVKKKQFAKCWNHYMISLSHSIKFLFSLSCVSYLTVTFIWKQLWILCSIRAGMATKKLMKLQLNLILNKLSTSVLSTWFTKELDYKAKFKTLTVLKISSNSWLLKSWRIC